MLSSLEVRPQLREIVDLAVEDHHETTVSRVHRLLARLAQIQNGQPPMPQRDAAGLVAPPALTVWAAMREPARHAGDGAAAFGG